MLLQLDEKHMKFEEMQLEKEAQQSQEERKFQMQLKQMMGQCYNAAIPVFAPPRGFTLVPTVQQTSPSSLVVSPSASSADEASSQFGPSHSEHMYSFSSIVDSDRVVV